MATITLPPAKRRLLDLAASELDAHGELTESPALGALTKWLEKNQRLVDAIVDERAWIHAFDSSQLANVIDRHLGDMEETPPEHELAALARELFAQGLDGAESFWGMEYPVHVAVGVVTSSGDELILGFHFETFAEIPPGTWDGLFRSRDAYVAWLHEQRLWTSMDQFDALSPAERLAEFCGVSFEAEEDSSGDEEDDRFDGSPDASDDDRWYLNFHYYAVQEVAPIGEIAWEHACDEEEDAYQAYFAQVAENYARYGAPLDVKLFDCRTRKVVCATSKLNEEQEVRHYLGER